jgi:hypothetical protein
LITVYLTVSVCFEKLYNACKVHDVPFFYVVFQFGLIGWAAYLCVGFANSGSVGFATLIDVMVISSSGWSKVVACLNSAGLAVSLVTQVLVMCGAQQYQEVSGPREYAEDGHPQGQRLSGSPR